MHSSDIEIEKRIVQTIADSLMIEKQNIRYDQKLIQDLGMDSLDFLDIIFALENTFKVKIRDHDFNYLLQPDRAESANQDEYLNEKEINNLVRYIPLLKEESLKNKILRKELSNYLTVDILINMVKAKIKKIKKVSS